MCNDSGIFKSFGLSYWKEKYRELACMKHFFGVKMDIHLLSNWKTV